MKNETKAQGRVRSALAGFPYSGGNINLGDTMTYSVIADNLENLAEVIQRDVDRHNADFQELTELRRQRKAIRDFLGIVQL